MHNIRHQYHMSQGLIQARLIIVHLDTRVDEDNVMDIVWSSYVQDKTMDTNLPSPSVQFLTLGRMCRFVISGSRRVFRASMNPKSLSPRLLVSKHRAFASF